MAHNRAPDPEDLRAFCAAADLGGVGRAAVRLRVSQPAVSKRLRHLEQATGVTLFERSAHGVKLTPGGRHLYDEAKRALAALDRVGEVVSGLIRSGGPVRLAASHSALEAVVSPVLGRVTDEGLSIELVTANSSVVRDMVADGRVDLGVAASRPRHTPYPGVREQPLIGDEIVLAVPDTHPWAMRDEVSVRELTHTRLVLRDAGSNSRWTIDAVMLEHELTLAEPLVETATPYSAMRESRARRAPVLISRAVLRGNGFHELRVPGISFPREFVVVLPALGEPTSSVTALVALMTDVAGAHHRPASAA